MLLRGIVALFCFFGALPISAETGIDVLGTHYSERLSRLLQHVEKTIGTNVVFVAKAGPGDNNGQSVAGKYQITLKPGSSEDDLAHELTHPLLETEGYARPFFIHGIALAQTIHSFIASDFDHLFINERLHREGYYPEKGFMAGMKDQYKSFAATRVSGTTPEQRALLGVAVIHELMKDVYYVKSTQAESAILETYPSYRNNWFTIKRAIEVFLRDPTPFREWDLVGVYNNVMDSIFSAVGMKLSFSDLIGFKPLPVTGDELERPAAEILSTRSDANTGLVRIKTGSILVAAGLGSPPDMTLPLKSVAPAVNIPLLKH